MLEALQPYITEIITIVVSALLAYLRVTIVPKIEAWFKAMMHERGYGAVVDSMWVAISRLGKTIEEHAKDGSLTKDDLVAIKQEARQIAADKLKRMGGFKKEKLMDWVDEQLDVALGKLQVLVSGKSDTNEPKAP